MASCKTDISLHSDASLFFVHFFAVTAQLDMKLPNFMFCVGRKQVFSQNSLSLPEIGYGS